MTVKHAAYIVKALEDKRKELSHHEKASAHYWNGDDWGSLSGYKDAENWVNEEVGKHLIYLLNVEGEDWNG